jgi:hypothetical protein
MEIKDCMNQDQLDTQSVFTLSEIHKSTAEERLSMNILAQAFNATSKKDTDEPKHQNTYSSNRRNS